MEMKTKMPPHRVDDANFGDEMEKLMKIPGIQSQIMLNPFLHSIRCQVSRHPV
jgi:hypothetical protein